MVSVLYYNEHVFYGKRLGQNHIMNMRIKHAMHVKHSIDMSIHET